METRLRRSTENAQTTIGLPKSTPSPSTRCSPRTQTCMKPLNDLSPGQNGLGIDGTTDISEVNQAHPDPDAKNRQSRTPKRNASPLQKEPEKKRKSDPNPKRRSSFVRGRITDPGRGLGLQLNISSDLTKSIPCDVPPDERLSQIAASAIEYTLGKLQMEYPDVDGVQQLQFKVMDSSENFISEMRKDGLFLNAVRKKINVLSVSDSTASMGFERATNECQVLQREIKTWEKLFDEKKAAMEKAEEKLSDVKAHPIISPPTGISEKDLEFLENKPDYEAIFDNIRTTRESIQLASEELANGVGVITSFLDHANAYLKSQASSLRTKSFAGIADFDEPQQIIAKIIDPFS